MKIKRGVGICHFNRQKYLGDIIKEVKATTPPETRIVVCDDGSTPTSRQIEDVMPGGPIHYEATHVGQICQENNVLLLQGANLGVAANKNRALWALQDCHYICILEDDLKPTHKGWFESYEKAVNLSGIHHFCRVQDKREEETIKAFSAFMNKHGVTPIYASSPRGDLTFLTSKVIREVGAFNPRFRGAGYAHGEWSSRVARAGLINHPLKWVDIQQARDSFVQIGDTEGGRWTEDETVIKRQLQRNKAVLKELNKQDYLYHPLGIE